MTRTNLLAFMRQNRLGVVGTVSADGMPQTAVVGIAISDDLEVIFDTIASTRKCQNLRRFPKIAIVIGWDGEITVQYEGVPDEPQGEERERIRQIYFSVYPDGVERLAWEGITHFRVRPTWLRYSDYTPPVHILEFDEAALKSLEP